ncbi:MAG: phosphate/phosphite/phosphonate ABC transporter substrate-binding protein [Burkholderiales bacterium]|nr:phosphate/phosphite/phosphonate ABC transporter substrate-binding protein [Burkholderiales bacterium]
MSFGVISQRSAVLTAQYWNPILRYVSQRSGVPLQLKLSKTGNEHAAMIRRGEFDFIYSNHNFIPENDTVGYRVMARPLEDAIRGQIIVLADSPIRSLAELQDKEVAFPSPVAFVGYYVPMDALLRAGIRVMPRFAGNQEGAMGQLASRRTQAAGINSQIARDFALRQQLAYRVLWSSEEFLNIPISVHPSVPADKAEAVRAALFGMSADSEGKKILAESAAVIHQSPPFGFVKASDADFDNARRFYKSSLVNRATQ